MLRATAPLTHLQERDLVRRAQAGDERAAERLLSSQVPYLRREAARRRAGAVRAEVDDLVAVGLEAFLAALQTFDPSRGTRLYTHARRAVEAAMAGEVARTDGGLPIPDRTARKVRRALRETGGCVASARVFAQTAEGVGPATFDDTVAALRAWGSLDAHQDASPTSPDGAREPVEPLGLIGSRGPRPYRDPVATFTVHAALLALTDRERDVLDLTVMTAVPFTDREAAAVLGVSRATITRLRKIALATLREVLGSDPREASRYWTDTVAAA